MADKKISALTSLAQGDVAASTDVLPIVDTSATETKKITASALVGAGMTAGVTNVDINSGAIDGTTIGASSASTGAFTTLSASSTVSGTGFSTYLASPPAIGGTTAAAGSFTTLTTSSTVTLNGGTANGVLYLNGSKVATSGTALVFDGTNLGVGTTSPTKKIDARVNTAGEAALVLISNDNTAGTGGSPTVASLEFASSGVAKASIAAAVYGNDWLSFRTGSNTERMRLTTSTLYTDSSINVGIGTASPDANFKLDVQAATGRVKLTSTTGTNSVVYQANNTGGTLNVGIDSSTGGSLFGVGAYAAGVWYSGNYPLVFGVNNAEGFRLTSSTLYTASGINVGIGTSSPATKLDTAGTVRSTTQTVPSSGTGAELYYDATNAGLRGYNRTGSAYVNLALNDNMYVGGGSSGNVGIGASSPGQKLTVQGGINVTSSATLPVAQGPMLFSYEAPINRIYMGDGTGYSFAFSKRVSSTTTDLMVLTDGGSLGIGTTSPGFKLDVQGTTPAIRLKTAGVGTGFKIEQSNATGDVELNVIDGYPLIFKTNNTNRALITSGGQFQVASALAGSNLLDFNNSSATGYGISVSVNNDSSGTYRYFEGYSTSAAAQRIAIYTNGDVKNTNGVFAAFSDAKLKKDIVDAGSQWDDIKALRVRKYRLKDDATEALQIGLIAQEVEQVSPGLVNESQDEARDEDGNIVLTGEVTKGVKYSILYMKAVKALQEAMARIEKLEAEMALLKGA